MTTYYVDPLGSDAAAGTSEGTAWATVNKVNISSFVAGDSILFKRGGVWREQLTLPSSGSSGSPITIGAYSTGAKPRLAADDIVSAGWTLEGGAGVWTADLETETSAFTTQFTGKTEAASNVLSVTTAAGQFQAGAQGGKIDYAGTAKDCHAHKNIADQTVCYLRAYFKFSTGYDLVTSGHWVPFLILRDNSSATDLLRFMLVWFTGGGMKFRFQTGAGTTIYESATNEVVRDQWYMIEGEFRAGTGSNGVARVWIDGVEKGTALTAQTWSTLAADQIQVGSRGGLGTGTPTATSEIYFDTIKVDTTGPIGAGGGAGSLWYVSRASIPHSAAYDSVLLKNVALKADLTTGEWWYDDPNDRVYIADDPGGHTVELGTRASASDTNGKSWIIYDGLEMTGGGGNLGTLRLAAASANGIVRNCEFRRCYQGVAASSSVGNDWTIEDNIVEDYYMMAIATGNSSTVTGWIIRRNTIRDMVECPQIMGSLHPQGIFAELSAPLIEYNTVENIIAIFAERFSTHGAYVSNCVDPIVRWNVFKRCHGYGFKFSTCTGTVRAYRNICYESGAGIGILGTPGAELYHNIMWNNRRGDGTVFGWGFGLHVMTHNAVNSTDIILKNNIIGNSEYFGAGDYQIRVEPANSILESDYNLVFSDLGTADLFQYQGAGGAFAKTWAEWQALGFDLNGINADPDFVDPSTGDFHLLGTSPAIDEAVLVPGV